MPRGREADYRPLYNTRASYNGDLLPGKFNGNTNRAYVPYNGKENSVSNFEVRRNFNLLKRKLIKFFIKSFFRSQPASNGQFPAKAVPGRRISSGETLYIGRVEFEGSIIPRKIHPSVGILIIPYGGYELGYSNY